METVMTSSFFESTPILKTLLSKIDKQVEIKDSTIPNAGKGLFAKKAIKANTLVGFYPAHALGVEDCFVYSNEKDASYFADHPSPNSDYLHCTDQPLFQRPSLLLQGDTNNPVYLDVNPNRPITTGWVSQMINDGAIVSEPTEAGILQYYQAAKVNNNCVHIPFGPSPILATITTKKLKAGSELFTTYGGVYWLGNFANHSVPITPVIRQEIQATAKTLQTCIQTANRLYSNPMEALQLAYENL